jgi:hypothetical protein
MAVAVVVATRSKIIVITVFLRVCPPPTLPKTRSSAERTESGPGNVTKGEAREGRGQSFYLILSE